MKNVRLEFEMSDRKNNTTREPAVKDDLSEETVSEEGVEPPSEVVVTVNEKALSDVGTVAKRLEKAGLAVDHVLDFVETVDALPMQRGIALGASRRPRLLQPHAAFRAFSN